MKLHSDLPEDRFGALFPRVHVSETRVSGPRAPPRNKMALFERFTVPSHRFLRSEHASHKEVSDLRESRSFSSGLNKRSSSKNKQVYTAKQSCSDASCSKGKREASGGLIAKDKLYSSGVTSEGTRTILYHGNDRDCLFDVSSFRKKHCHNSPCVSAAVNCDQTIKKRNTASTESSLSLISKNSISTSSNSQIKDETSNVTTKSSFADQAQEVNSVRKPQQSCDNLVEENEAFMSCAASNDCSVERSPENEACGPKHSVITIENNSAGLKPVTESEDMDLKRKAVQQTKPECSGNAGDPTEITSQVAAYQEHLFKQIGPKNVIAAIGQRKFWEARRTILQQQRTLSLQVFELHRAIKVQKLLANMPEFLLDESSKDTTYERLDANSETLGEPTSSSLLERKINEREKHQVSKQQSEKKQNISGKTLAYNGGNDQLQSSTQTSLFSTWSSETKVPNWTYPSIPVMKLQASSQLENPFPMAYACNTIAFHSALPYPNSGWLSRPNAQTGTTEVAIPLIPPHSAGGAQSSVSFDMSNFFFQSFPCARMDKPSCSYKATDRKFADREFLYVNKPERTLACTNDSKSALVPKIIRAVPRSAAVAAQSAAEILKTLQEESQR